MKSPTTVRTLVAFISATLFACPAGCGTLFAPPPAQLFTTLLEIDGENVGHAIIDTGGGYELMLRSRYGLEVVETVEVLAFTGRRLVGLTEQFPYTAGGIETSADGAIVGLDVCDCNGIGFQFFRKTGAVLGIDFPAGEAEFHPATPESGGVVLPFEDSPPQMQQFDSAFVTVNVIADGQSRKVLGLLDTGTNWTVLRRGLFPSKNPLIPDQLDVQIGRDDLGVVAARVGLFDTPGLPDLILGTDVMRAWSDRWYFRYDLQGGEVIAFPPSSLLPAPSGIASVRTEPRP